MKINRIFFSLIVCMFIFINCKTSKNCENFHTGTFICSSLKHAVFKVTRNDIEQLEYVGDTVAAVFSVKWLDECSYLLISKNLIYKFKEYEVPKDTVKIKIIEILSDSSCRYLATTKDDEQQGIMMKVNP